MLSPEMVPRLLPGRGNTHDLGATITPEGVNFAVYSSAATALWVSIFDEHDSEVHRFPFDVHHDGIHAALIAGLAMGTRYGLRADGPYAPDSGLFFDPARLLVDPYARQLDRAFAYSPDLRCPRDPSFDTAPLVPKAVVVEKLAAAIGPLLTTPKFFYELNVRGFTMRHPQVPPAERGTLKGLGAPAVIEHFQQLGVDTLQLMPVTAWIDERHLPPLGLSNAWGYNPIAYGAIDPRLAPGGIADLRQLTDRYREAGIAVILDVVFNHTGESDAQGPILSLMGLDPQAYFWFADREERQELVNYTGTGNTLRCNHPATQRLVIDSLRFWVEEGGVSGFRFDLAPVLGREPEFNPRAELLERIKADPLLSRCILAAEPWDPGPGGYRLGQFGPPFREHNDTYRDGVRAFWRGEPGSIGRFAAKLAGSAELFDRDGRTPASVINLLAVHDGFTLRDLVSYAHKHNQANGEDNRDGHNHNLSWNCGVEGETEDAQINLARRRDVRALLATLLLSRGGILLQQGDELFRTQGGNNNAYAQDNEITWLDWSNGDRELAALVAAVYAFRQEHPAVHADRFLNGTGAAGHRDVTWLHPSGHEMNSVEWEHPNASVLGMHLCYGSDDVLIWFNRRHDSLVAQLPAGDWSVGLASDLHPVIGGGTVTLGPRSVVALVRGKADNDHRPAQ
ncbi:glycogen debranching protein GlgX [Devosia sp. 919]|uniref:glycogen debranching protein GlgX n=1 Tax=Devosia sp. 919 TaxID=2726065 RepID=UPI0032C1E086